MRSNISTLVALAASASAITITFPNVTDVNGIPRIDFSIPQVITWDSVANDPKTINITLVTAPKDANTPPTQSINVASNVNTADDKYTMQPPSEATVNGTYQIFFYAQYNATTNGIVAESHDFIISKIPAGRPSTTTGSSPPSKTSGTTTVSTTSASQKNSGATLKTFGGLSGLVGAAMLFL